MLVLRQRFRGELMGSASRTGGATGSTVAVTARSTRVGLAAGSAMALPAGSTRVALAASTTVAVTSAPGIAACPTVAVPAGTAAVHVTAVDLLRRVAQRNATRLVRTAEAEVIGADRVMCAFVALRDVATRTIVFRVTGADDRVAVGCGGLAPGVLFVGATRARRKHRTTQQDQTKQL